MGWIFLGALGLLYLFPSGFALARKHPHWWGIIPVNILIGWTLVGWFAVVFWAAAWDPLTEEPSTG